MAAAEEREPEEARACEPETPLLVPGSCGGAAAKRGENKLGLQNLERTRTETGVKQVAGAAGSDSRVRLVRRRWLSFSAVATQAGCT